MKIIVVNKTKHTKTDYDVYIGRPSIFGNPYPIPVYGRDLSIDLYKAEILCCLRHEMNTVNFNYQNLYKKLEEIANREMVYLVCFCVPKNCHGFVLKDILIHIQNGDIISPDYYDFGDKII